MRGQAHAHFHLTMAKIHGNLQQPWRDRGSGTLSAAAPGSPLAEVGMCSQDPFSSPSHVPARHKVVHGKWHLPLGSLGAWVCITRTSPGACFAFVCNPGKQPECRGGLLCGSHSRGRRDNEAMVCPTGSIAKG